MHAVHAKCVHMCIGGRGSGGGGEGSEKFRIGECEHGKGLCLSVNVSHSVRNVVWGGGHFEILSVTSFLCMYMFVSSMSYLMSMNPLKAPAQLLPSAISPHK